MAKKPHAPDLDLLLPSWQLSLRADRKAETTLKTYSDGVRFYLAWCAEAKVAPLDRSSLRSWVAALLDKGNAATTAVARQLAVRRFVRWMVEEGEIPADPFLGLRAPKVDTKVIEPLTDDELRALLKACTPPKGATAAEMMRHRRDEAILRLMMETGARAGEVVALERADVDAGAGTAIIRRGKGGKGRVVPFGPHTALALDRYMRLRTHHRLATSPALWLGDRGKMFSYDALHQALAQRATAAGIVGFHPHKMRHTAAHRWLAAGGSEGGLMAVAGWTRPDMLMRYTKARASSRAATEARGLNLGEL
ncbi:MAG: tyrosine-type recombinase/integrase [Phycicoccus sp.]|nr:tyrosine-type recombinase/integrase [Phycicoccus sp.]